MWVNIRTSPIEGLGCKHQFFFSVQLDMRPCDFEFQDYFAHSRDAQGETNIFLRWMSSDRLEETQNKNAWICRTIWHGWMFDGIWCSIPIISRGNIESTGQLTQGTPFSRKHWTTNNDVTFLEHLLFARPLLSRLRDWLVKKEAETAVQEDWYVWGTAQCLLCCASTKLWMKIRLGFGMYFALSLPAVVSIVEGFGGYVQDSGAETSHLWDISWFWQLSQPSNLHLASFLAQASYSGAKLSWNKMKNSHPRRERRYGPYHETQAQGVNMQGARHRFYQCQ